MREMNKMHEHLNQCEVEKKTGEFEARCRENGLKITPQRIAVYKALVQTDLHPTAEEVYQQVRRDFSTISLDTVNRTLLTLTEIGAAFIVEGTGQPRRYDGGLDDHQHFRCVKCGKIVDFHCEPLREMHIPDELQKKFTILRKTVYLEGMCDGCSNTPNNGLNC
jgi:Fur family peroxide stress response transcriptional regulator